MPLGIVVGLAAEARIARLLGDVGIGGGTPAGAAAAAEALVAGGATALLSFGLAGGLDPVLRPGALLVPATVLTEGMRYSTDAEICRALGGATIGVLLAADAVVAGAGAKRRLSELTGASAVDLESGAVARAALAHALPFAVLRAVCDPAERNLPPAALVALDRRGGIGALRVIGSIAGNPWQIVGLLRLAVDAARARHALLGAARRFSLRLGG